MSEDIYVYEAIDVEPAITEDEVEAKIAAGEYQKVTWENDGRIGDGYFVKVGERGMIGLAMVPELDEGGGLRHRGVAVQANPLDENHRVTTIKDELRRIVDDFGTAPDGTPRRLTGPFALGRWTVSTRSSCATAKSSWKEPNRQTLRPMTNRCSR